MADPSPDVSSLVASVATVPGYWQLDILWSPLVSTEQTGGTYSLMEQLMPPRPGRRRTFMTTVTSCSTSWTASWPSSSAIRS